MRSPFSRTSSSPTTTNLISSSATGRVCILSIDGGGSTSDGLLARLKAFIRKLSNDPTSRIADFFDLATRSDASGVLVTMLFVWASNGHPLFSANEAHCLLSKNHSRLATFDEQGFLHRIF
ncbi:putative Patatin-like protein 7 [Cocos nucifera]|nr:putative Patatin-like protein 7 [Cocos nucifera]